MGENSDFSGSVECLAGERITLRDIAEQVGMSHVTVSLALRNDPKISDKTRERIQRKADEMGYRPDPMLRSLSMYRHSKRRQSGSMIMAWLNPWGAGDASRYPEVMMYREGAEAHARQMGCRIDEFDVSRMSARRLNTILKTRSITGVLVPPGFPPQGMFRYQDMPWDEFHVVQLGGGPSSPSAMHLIERAHDQNVTLAVSKMHARGYRRIGYVRKCTGNGNSADYYWGRIPEEVDPVPSILDLHSNDLKTQRDLFATWLDEETPDAILADTDDVAGYLEDLGVRIPDEMALATTNTCLSCIDAGVDPMPQEVGRMGCSLLESLISGMVRGLPIICHRILVNGIWVDGTTLPKR